MFWKTEHLEFLKGEWIEWRNPPGGEKEMRLFGIPVLQGAGVCNLDLSASWSSQDSSSPEFFTGVLKWSFAGTSFLVDFSSSLSLCFIGVPKIRF